MCLSRTSDHILINLDQLLDKIFGHISRSILWRKVWTQFFSKMLSQIVVLECWSKFANQFWTKHWLKFMSSFCKSHITFPLFKFWEQNRRISENQKQRPITFIELEIGISRPVYKKKSLCKLKQYQW